MTGRDALVEILAAVRAGDLDVQSAADRFARWPFEDVAFARIDHHRAVRTGFPEVVYGPGKTPEHVATAMERIAAEGGLALATRVSAEQAEAVTRLVPDAVLHSVPMALVIDRRTAAPGPGGVVVVSAGTSDAPVAEEAALTAELVSGAVQRVYDAGVAGIHRLLGHLETLQMARAVVVVAGMEGALPGVVAGLIEAPVIACPTSVGYGAHLGGMAPLLTMLNSCASGLAVVNIDNGFAAGYMAGIIALRSATPMEAG